MKPSNIAAAVGFVALAAVLCGAVMAAVSIARGFKMQVRTLPPER